MFENFLMALAFLFQGTPTSTTIYVSPAGEGQKDGLTPASSMSIATLNTAITRAGAGGRVVLLADKGQYKVTTGINLTAGGTDSYPVHIVGGTSSGQSARPVIVGTRNATYSRGMAAGNELFRIMPGANNLAFTDISVQNTGTAFRVGGNVSNLSVSNVDANNVARFFENYVSGSSTSATISGLQINNVKVVGFSKGVVRLQYNTNNVQITNVFGDSNRQDGDNFAIGIHLDGTVHDVLVADCFMQNIADSTNSYWNGDGYATERGVYRVQFKDSAAYNNTDGGFDLKSTETELIGTTASGNARNYRLWGQISLKDAIAADPRLWGGIGNQLQIEVKDTAQVTASNLQVLDSGSNTLLFRIDGYITVYSGRFVMAREANLFYSGTGKTYSLLAPQYTASTGPFSSYSQ